MTNPRCMEIAKATCVSTDVRSWAGFIILQKMTAIKEKLKIWNKEEFGDVNSALQDTEAEHLQLDLIAEERPLSSEEKTTRCKAK